MAASNSTWRLDCLSTDSNGPWRHDCWVYPLFLRGAPSGVGAFGDERALELSDAGEHGQDPLAGGRGGVGPRLGQRPQAGAGAVEIFREVEQIPCRASQAIQASGHHHIPRAQRVRATAPVRGGRGGYRRASLRTGDDSRRRARRRVGGRAVGRRWRRGRNR